MPRDGGTMAGQDDKDDKGGKPQVRPAYAAKTGTQPRAAGRPGRPLPPRAPVAEPKPAGAMDDPEAGRPRAPAPIPGMTAPARRPATALPEPAAEVPVAPGHELAPPRHFDPRNGIMDFVGEYADKAAAYAHVAGQYATIGDSRECLRALKMFYAVAKQLVAQVDDLELAIDEYGKDDLEAFRYPMG